MQAHGPADTDQTVPWLQLLWTPHELLCTTVHVVWGIDKIRASPEEGPPQVCGGQALKSKGLEVGDTLTLHIRLVNGGR